MNAEDIVMPNPGEFGDVPSASEEPVRTREDDILLNEGIDFNGSTSFFSDELPPFDWVVEGMLAAGTEGQRGFKGDLIAGSKGRKSFFAIQLGLCVAAGMDVCGYRVPKARKVAYLNLELVPRGFQERVWRMCRSLGLKRGEVSGNFTPITVAYPGRLRQDDILGAFIRKLRDGGYSLVIIDPQYKLYEVGEDECTGVGLSGVLRFRDRIITEAKAAVLVVQHDSKGGSTADKKITDRGAGSGFAGRDYDARWTLTPHADGDDRHIVLASSSRYRAKQLDRTLVFDEENMVFLTDEEISPVQQTLASASETLNAGIRAKKAAANAQLAATVVASIAGELGNRLEDINVIAAQFQEMTGWGVNRSKTAIEEYANKGEVIADTKELTVRKDGTIGRAQHARTLVGRPECIAAYLADIRQKGKRKEAEDVGAVS